MQNGNLSAVENIKLKTKSSACMLNNHVNLPCVYPFLSHPPYLLKQVDDRYGSRVQAQFAFMKDEIFSR